MSENDQIEYVRKKCDNIKNIQNPSERVQLAAVSRDGRAIQHIQNPSERVQLAAVEKDGWAIRFIQNPSPNLFTDPEVKKSVIKSLLIDIKKGKYVGNLIEYLKQHQVNWPELEKIESVMNKKSINEQYSRYIPTIAEKLRFIADELTPFIAVAKTRGYNFKKLHIGQILKIIVDHIDRRDQLSHRAFEEIDLMMMELSDISGTYSYEMQRRMNFFSNIRDLVEDLWLNADTYFN